MKTGLTTIYVHIQLDPFAFQLSVLVLYYIVLDYILTTTPSTLRSLVTYRSCHFIPFPVVSRYTSGQLMTLMTDDDHMYFGSSVEIQQDVLYMNMVCSYTLMYVSKRTILGYAPFASVKECDADVW